MTDLASRRSEAEILGRTGIALSFGDSVYRVRPRSIKSNRMWKELVQRTLGEKFSALDALDGVDAFYGYLSDSVEMLVDLVISYDETNALPARSNLEEIASDHDILEAFMVLIEQAFPFFEIGRKFLPGDTRTIIVGKLIEAALISASRPPTSGQSQPGASTIRPRSRRR